MKLKQDTKVEADKLVRDIKRATSAESESARTTKKPHRRNDEAHRATKCCCSVQTNGNRTGLRFQPTGPGVTSSVLFCPAEKAF